MHRHVASNVVEDIGLGEVIELVGAANGNGGRKFAVAETVEKAESGNIAAHRFSAKTGERPQEAVDVFQAGHLLGIETQAANTFKEMRVSVATPFGQHARIERAPSCVFFF